MPSTFDPNALNSADKSNGSLSLDQVNQAFRQSPVYQQWMTAHGKPTNGMVALNGSEEAGLEKTLENNGFALPNGWHVDAGGNIAGDSHIARNLLIGAGVVAAAFGVPAVLGAIGGGAGAAGAAAGVEGAGSTLGMSAALPGALGAADLAGGVGAAAAGAGAVGAAGGAGGIGSILGTAGKVGTALSSIAGGLQQGRQQQTVDQQNQDRNQISAAQVNLGAPDKRIASSVKGDILSNAKDFSYGAPTMVGNIPVPSSTGGLRPSIFSPNTKALGSLVSSQALGNETADGGNPVQLTPIPQASGLSNILGTAGIVGQLGSLLSPFKRPATTAIPNVGGFE